MFSDGSPMFSDGSPMFPDDLSMFFNISSSVPVIRFTESPPRNNSGGLHVINVFVEKPFIKNLEKEHSHLWKSGELFMHYHDWKIHTMEEFVFDCNSGGVAHQHCMDVMIAEMWNE